MAARIGTIGRRRTAAWLAGLVVAAVLIAAAAQPAVGAKLPRYHLRVFRGPAGSQSVLNKISDDGTAVGQRLLRNGTSRALVLGRRRFGGLGGRQAAFVGINGDDQAAGSLILGPNATNPLYWNAGRATALSLPGSANGITLGPLVAVTATASDGQQHVLVWTPTTGAVRDLGQGIARGIGVGGIVLGRTLGGQAAYWTADGAIHVLGFNGTLLQVNLFGRVIGISNQSGGPRPITLDLRNPGLVTNLKLPRGWRFGTAKGISDSGLIVGDAFKKSTGGLPSLGLVWFGPTRSPVAAQKLVRRLPRGVTVTDAGGVNDNGLIVGSTTGPRGSRASAAANAPEEDAMEMEPDPLSEKIVELRRVIDGLGSFFGAPNGALTAKLNAVNKDLSGTSGSKLCKDVRELEDLFSSFSFESEDFTPAHLQLVRKNGARSALELGIEVLCFSV